MAEPAAEPQPFNYVDAETLARLRSVGSKVRKSVTEGFQRTVSVPADPAAARQRLPFTQTPSFISSNDALRESFAARRGGTSSAPSSPQQRPKRGLREEEEEQDELDGDALDLEGAEARVPAAGTVEKAKRQIKPLRRSASRGGVQSLPASMFRMGIEDGAPFKPAAIPEEEDWSDANFGSTAPAVVNII